MRYPTVIKTAIVIITSTSAFAAESTYERELKQLSEQRDKAVAVAVDPINRRYQASLDQLLKRATQANALDDAIKIRAAIAAASTPASATTAKSAVSGTAKRESLKSKLSGSTWRVYDSGDIKLDTITFNADGTTSGRINGGKWEVTSGTTFKLHNTNGETVDCTINEAGTEIQIPVWKRVLRKE